MPTAGPKMKRRTVNTATSTETASSAMPALMSRTAMITLCRRSSRGAMRWYDAGARNTTIAAAAPTSATLYRSRPNSSSSLNRWLNGAVRRKAKRTWTPGRMVRSSSSSSR